MIVTYFGRHNETSFDGLRPTLEAPSTRWSEWMPTGVHSSDTGIRDEMRWAYRHVGHHNLMLMDEWGRYNERHSLMPTVLSWCYLGLCWVTYVLLNFPLLGGGFSEIGLLANVMWHVWGLLVWLRVMLCVLALYDESIATWVSYGFGQWMTDPLFRSTSLICLSTKKKYMRVTMKMW